jgi:hypothetical protein
MIIQKNFEIKVPNIEECAKSVVNPSDKNVGYAIESLFSIEEDIFIYWKGYEIPLSIKYDISEIWNDMILMIQYIKKAKTQNFTIHWPSATFFATWDFVIDDNLLEIKAYWTDLNINRTELLKLREDSFPIIVDKKDFLEEWNKILIPIRNVILKSSYNTNKLKNFKKFLDLIE